MTTSTADNRTAKGNQATHPGMPLASRFAGIDNIATHTFLPQRLTPSSIVVDLGANAGEFSTSIARRYGVQCLAVEANPSLYTRLQARETPQVRFFNFAISGDETPVTLNISGYDESSTITNNAVPDAAGTVTVPAKRLHVFLEEQGVDVVALLKVDIEGAETAMFDSLSDEWLSRIDQITIEMHDDHGFMTVAAANKIIDRLRSVGFVGVKFSPNNTNWMFVRQPAVGIVQHAYLKYIVRNARGVLRRMGFRND